MGAPTISAYTGMLGDVGIFTQDFGSPMGLNKEDLEHAAIEMNMTPDDIRAMVGNEESKHRCREGVDDEV